MRSIAAASCVIVLLLSALAVYADGPVAPAEGKLFGMTLVLGGPEGDDWGPDESILFPLYEKSGATVAYVGTSWGDCEASDPGSGQSKYDFSGFDKQLFLTSTKTKVCSLGLWNSWADKVKDRDPARYWKLAEAFVTEFAKHANSKGIKHFSVAGNEYDLLGRGDWAQLYVEPLKHIYTAIKAASKDNVVIAGNLSHGSDDVVQALYDAGAKGYFDVLNLHTYSNDPKTGVDIFQVVSAHRAMVRNGDGDKLIFLGEGWGPGRSVPGIVRTSPEEAPSQAEIEAMRGFVENGYRNMLTERDIYDPKWLLGAQFFTMNDNYGQRKWKDRAKTVDEDGDGKPDYILLDGYKFPPDFGIDPAFFNGGLVGFDGKPKADLLDNFLPRIPEHRFEGQIVADGPIFNYVTEKPYKLALTFTNLTQGEITLEKFGVSSRSDRKGITADAKLDGEAPKSVAAGASATANFLVTLPREAAGRQVTLIGELDYKIGERKHFTDCWVTLLVTPQLEVTLLPGRLIMDPVTETKRVGMSVINHTDALFEGKIALTATPGLTVSPAETDTKIESFGLEAYVFGVTAGKDLQPGHYAVNIDIGGKMKDWVAVDVPAVAKKLKVQVDGKLDDWQGVSPYALANPSTGADGKTSWKYIGKLWLAYDESGLHAAVQVDDEKHVQNRDPGDVWQDDSIQIALDPLMNGARTQSGGYRDDDYEYAFAQAKAGLVVFRSKGTAWKPVGPAKGLPFAFRSESGKSVYEVSIPWTEMAVPSDGKAGADHRVLDPKTDRRLAVSVLVNRNDGSGRTYVEWGGGIARNKDPRLFIPVILGE